MLAIRVAIFLHARMATKEHHLPCASTTILTTRAQQCVVSLRTFSAALQCSKNGLARLVNEMLPIKQQAIITMTTLSTTTRIHSVFAFLFKFVDLTVVVKFWRQRAVVLLKPPMNMQTDSIPGRIILVRSLVQIQPRYFKFDGDSPTTLVHWPISKAKVIVKKNDLQIF